MKLLFKVAAVAPADPEVQHTNFKTFYPEVNHSMAWDELAPYVEQATEIYVLPYVGSDTYDPIADAFETDGGTSLSGKQKELMRLLQRAIAYYTIAHALPKKLTVMASMGAVNANPSGGAVPPAQWMFKNALWSVTKDADTFLDAALAYLQKEVATFTAWKASDAYSEGKADFFRSVKEFQAYHHIGSSFRTFLALLGYIQKATDRYIRTILGDSLLDELVTAVKGGGALSDDQKKLLHYVRSALAPWSVFMAIPHLTCIVEQDGLKVVSSTDGMDSRGNATSAFYKEGIDRHRMSCEDNGRTAQADLVEFLFKKSADFPAWLESDYYKAATTSDCSSPVIGSELGGVWL